MLRWKILIETLEKEKLKTTEYIPTEYKQVPKFWTETSLRTPGGMWATPCNEVRMACHMQGTHDSYWLNHFLPLYNLIPKHLQSWQSCLLYLTFVFCILLIRFSANICLFTLKKLSHPIMLTFCSWVSHISCQIYFYFFLAQTRINLCSSQVILARWTG